MEGIYGYKEKDVIGLAEFIKERKGQSLSKAFESYAVISGKAKGTVRNLYYALVKHSQKDGEFCNRYLDGKPLTVNKIVEFDEAEEREIIKQILLAKRDGRSVRSKIMELAGGDGKLALRYQNKFRGAVRNKPRLIAEIVEELKKDGKEVSIPQEKNTVCTVSDVQLKRLKNEINNLVLRISEKTLRENKLLKERVAYLERENLKLSSKLYGNAGVADALKYFRSRGGENVVN